MIVALAIRRPGFYFWLCHWPAEWLKTNDFHTSAKFQRASVRLSLSHFPPSCPFTAPDPHTFAIQSWPLLCLVIPYTSYSSAATSWHASLLYLGCRAPKQKGNFSPTSQFYQKHLRQLSLHELKPDTSREALFLEHNSWTIISGAHSVFTCIHLMEMWKVKRSTYNYVPLFSLLPVPLMWKIPQHKDNIFIFHGLHRKKRLQLSQGRQVFLCPHDYRFIFPPSRSFPYKTISVTT